MSIGPNTALALTFSGILGIYVECLRPGRIVPGCVGLALIAWGSYTLFRYGPTSLGCFLLGAAVLLFALEILFNARYLAGAAATIVLFCGVKLLLPSPRGVQSVFGLSVCLVLGSITTLLCASAREARRNKQADLSVS